MDELDDVLQKFLKSCEESFADRYTETDVEFSKHCEATKIKVPVEERWFVRPPRSHQRYDNRDRSDRDRGDRDRGDRGRWEQRGGYNRDRDNRRDRDNYGRQRRGGHYNDRNHSYSRPY